MNKQYFPGRTLARFRYLGAKAAGGLVFGMLLVLSMLVIATGPNAEPVERAEREWPVSYREVSPAAMAPTIQVYGKLETDQSATLRAGITATVTQVLRREGDWVEAGDTLISETGQRGLRWRVAKQRCGQYRTNISWRASWVCITRPRRNWRGRNCSVLSRCMPGA